MEAQTASLLINAWDALTIVSRSPCQANAGLKVLAMDGEGVDFVIHFSFWWEIKNALSGMGQLL